MTKIPVTIRLKSVFSILEKILNRTAVQFNVMIGALASLLTLFSSRIIVLPFLDIDLDLVNTFIAEKCQFSLSKIRQG